MLPKMWNMFEKKLGKIERDVVKEHHMLVDLPHVAYVRDDSNIELLCHCDHREILADTSQTSAISLTNPNGIGLKEVLPDDSVGNCLPYCDGCRVYFPCKSF